MPKMKCQGSTIGKNVLEYKVISLKTPKKLVRQITGSTQTDIFTSGSSEIVTMNTTMNKLDVKCLSEKSARLIKG